MQDFDSLSNTGRLLHVCISDKKGVCKREISSARVVVGHGLEGDAHAGDWHRQVSLLAHQDIEAMRAKGLSLIPGSFGENLVLDGIDTCDLGIGSQLQVGPILLELSQIGKVCHTRCAIYYKTGDCIMPRTGLFARVLEGGIVAPGMNATVVSRVPRSTIQAAILTASDRCAAGEIMDTAGPAVAKLLQEKLGAHIAWKGVVQDDLQLISGTLKELVERRLDLILTVGGTGLSPRDATPEATRSVLDRELPGFCKAMRAGSSQVTRSGLLSRAVAGISRESLIINLPGSQKASLENLAVVLPALRHAINVVRNQPSHAEADAGRLVTVKSAEPDLGGNLQVVGVQG